MLNILRRFQLIFLLLLLAAARPGPAQIATADTNAFSFIVAGDMRSYIHAKKADQRQFDGVCEAALRAGPGEFMISPGDCDPPGPIRDTISRILGTNYLWYPVIGNHDAESPANMEWLHHWAEAGIPHLVRPGPEGAKLSSYSFDFGNAHFVALNEYYNGKSEASIKGDVPDAASTWLEADLSATHQPLIFVIGHKPIKSIPDMDSGRTRHDGDSVSDDKAHLERFVNLLKQHHVRAYICGHTHNTSVERVDGLWQTDSGHARGAGDPGSPSSFLKFRINGDRVWVDINRSDTNGVAYTIRKTVELN